MNTNVRLKEFVASDIEHLKSLDAPAYYEFLRNNIDEIQKRYAKGAMDIVDRVSTEDIIKELGSKIEALVIVDENDEYYRNKDGFWASEFRQDYTNYPTLPDSKERTVFCRVTLSVLEDMEGNVIVSRRSPNKTHPNMLEIPGGHVSVGHEYLETCIREMEEELGFTPESVSESDRIAKFRGLTPGPKPGTHGRGTMMTIYRVKTPGIEFLKPDNAEIAELITMTPEDLLACIQKNDEGNKFDANHACMYLEYLKTRLPNRIDEITQSQEKLGHTLTKIDTFSKDEKLS